MNDQVVKIVGEVLKVSQLDIENNITIDQLDGWDSMKHMDLIVSLEEGLGIQFDGDEIAKMRCTQVINDIACDKLKGKI